MTSDTSELSQLQHWFLTVMTAAGGVEHGMELAQLHYGLAAPRVVKHEHDAQIKRRMQIYSEGYILRLLECLQTDYPVLHEVMGDALFNFFAKAYIWQQPSNSPTLYDLGAGFSAFLQHSQSAANADMAAMLLLPLELARLERARTEAVRAPGLEQSPSPAPFGAFDWIMGQELRIGTPACLRLLQLSMPLLEFWQSVGREEPIPSVPAAGNSYVAVSRMRYHVTMLELEAWQYLFLQALQADDTASVHDGIAAAARQADLPADQVLTKLMLWLPVAQSMGFIHASSVAL
jgi:hypothetical protein